MFSTTPAFDQTPATIPQHLLKLPSDKPVFGSMPSGSPDPESESTSQDKKTIICRQCHHDITTPDDKIAVNGAHRHTFANPGGIVYEIGCFKAAPGCALSGPPTDEFTWFAGHFWQVAICGRCLVHLGWHFSAKEGAGFFGLIYDYLIFP